MYSDIDILKGCKAGSQESQKALVMQYSELLNGTALRYVKDNDVAKDVLQDSFMRIFKYIHKFDPEKGKLSSWMCKIVINESLKVWRSQKEKVSYNEYFEQASERPFVIDELEASDIYQQILELDEPYRMVFNLNVIEGYPHKDIAKQLGIKVPSSRSILSRAKEMMREKLNHIKIKESWV